MKGVIMKKIMCLFFALYLGLCTVNAQGNESTKTDIDAVVKENATKYEITQNKKYLNIAYKWAMEGVDNKTKNINTIKTAIVLSSYKLKPKNMMKSYELFCEVDEDECLKYNEQYKKSLEETNKMLTDKNEKNKKNWTQALYGFAGGAAAGYTSGTRYNRPYYDPYNRPYEPTIKQNTTTKCRMIFDTLHCDTY